MRQTGEFWAASDDGRRYRILEFAEQIDNLTLDGPHVPVRGPKHFVTEDGQLVNFKAPGVFELAESGLLLRAVD